MYRNPDRDRRTGPAPAPQAPDALAEVRKLAEGWQAALRVIAQGADKYTAAEMARIAEDAANAR